MNSSSFLVRVAATTALIGAAISSQAQVTSWVFKSHMSISRGFFAAVTGSDGRIYAIGGTSEPPNLELNSMEAYDVTKDTWTTLASMTIGRVSCAAVATPTGKLYVIGGTNLAKTAPTSLEIYDIASNAWSKGADIPQSMGSPRAILGSDGNIYAVQGPANGAPAFYEGYNPGTDTWFTPSAKLPADSTSDPAVCYGPDGLAYFLGGKDSGATPTTVVERFDGHADLWSSGVALAFPMGEGCAALGADNHIYTMGGTDGSDVLANTEFYDFTYKGWFAGPNLQFARYAAQAATGPDGNIYVMGGSASNVGYTDTVECLVIPRFIGTGTNISVVEGSPFSGTTATFSDPNTSQQAVDFLATIQWGDGSAPTVGTVSDNGGGGQFKISGDHTYAHFGSYTATITITDVDGETATAIDAVTVADAKVTLGAANVAAQSNIPFSGPVGFFSDANPLAQITDFTATINWGDNTTTSATLLEDASGTKVDIDGTHTYSTPGAYSVHIKILEAGGGEFLIQEPATVTAPTAVVTAQHFNAVEGANYTGTVATFVDADPNQTAINFTATITWGDGTTSTGAVASNGSGGFTVTGSHTYAEEGSYATSVTVAVTGGLNSSSNGIGDVADAAIAAAGFSLTCKGQSFSDTVASFTDADLLGTTSDYSAGIYWGDGKSSAGTIAQAGSGWKVVGSHYYAKRGKYTVTVTIRDVGGSTASATTYINVGPVK